jgi:hypothetical protein
MKNNVAVSALLALCVSVPAIASTTVVDFTQVNYIAGTHDLVSNGVFFSPQCHFDYANQQDDPASTFTIDSPHGRWLGFDTSGCTAGPFSEGPNPGYSGPDVGLAPAQAFVRMLDYSAFSLLSFEWIRDGGPQGMTVVSSKGGRYSFTGKPSNTTFAFSGSEWDNLDWLVFQTTGMGGGTSGFDTLVLSSGRTVFVPEPGEWASWLGLAAFAGLGAIKRRARG